MTRDDWLSLARKVGICVAIGVVVLFADQLVMLRFQPVLTMLIAVAAGALWWATERLVVHEGPTWRQPSFHERSAMMQADVRTRRLSQELAQAQPGKGFGAGWVATRLADMAERRLAASGRTMDDAEQHLSRPMLDYFRSAWADNPKPINRKTLHAYLKEIDSL